MNPYQYADYRKQQLANTQRKSIDPKYYPWIAGGVLFLGVVALGGKFKKVWKKRRRK